MALTTSPWAVSNHSRKATVTKNTMLIVSSVQSSMERDACIKDTRSGKQLCTS